MGAPSLSGITVLNSMDTVTGVTAGNYVGSSTTSVGVISGYLSNAFRAQAQGGATGDVFYLRAAFTPTDFSTAGLMLLMWKLDTAASRLETKANQGIRLRVYSDASATQYREWVIGGSDGAATIATEFQQMVINPRNTSLANTTTGSFSLSTIQFVELVCKKSSATTSTIIMDQVVLVGNALQLVDGVGDTANLEDFQSYAVSTLLSKDIVSRAGANQYFAKTPIAIGNGSTQTAFSETLSALEFATASTLSSNPALNLINSNDLGLIINTTASSSILLDTCLINSATPYRLSSLGSGTIEITGGGIGNTGISDLARGSFTNVSFTNGSALNANGATIASAISRKSVGVQVTNAANDLISNSQFLDNTVGVLYDGVTGSIDISNVIFDGNTTDIRAINLGGGSLVITVHGGTDIGSLTTSTDGSGTLTLIPPPITFTAANLTSTEFNSVRCRLSLIPGGQNGIAFTSAEINTTNDTIALTGIDSKINSGSVIRFSGVDLPAPLETDRVYYPSSDYVSGDLLSVSATPGGTKINIADTGSGSMSAIIFTQLDLSLITSGAYEVNLTETALAEGVTLENGDILCLQAIHWKGSPTIPATASKYLEKFIQYQGSSISDLSVLETDILHNLFSLTLETDGSLTDEFSLDASSPGRIQIIINDADAITRTDRGYLFYAYVQWSFVGIQILRGQIEAISENELLVNGELTLKALQKTRIRGPYIKRADGDFIVSEDSELIEWEFTNLIGYTITQQVPVNLSDDVLSMLQSILVLVGNFSGGAGGSVSGPDLRAALGMASANLDTQLGAIAAYGERVDGLIENSDSGGDRFTAKALETAPSSSGSGATPEEIWAYGERSLTDKAGFSITTENITSIRADLPTTTDLNNRTLPSTDYFNPATDTVSLAPGQDTAIAEAMQTELNDDFAALANAIGDLPTNTEFQSRTLPSANYFDPAADRVIVGTNEDKSGYALTQVFPPNFALLGINLSGHVSRVTVCDTNTDMRGTDNAFLAEDYVAPPTASQNATAVRSELALELAFLDAPINSRSTFNPSVTPVNIGSVSGISVSGPEDFGLSTTDVQGVLAAQEADIAQILSRVVFLDKWAKADEQIRPETYTRFEAGTTTVLVQKTVTKDGFNIDLA